LGRSALFTGSSASLLENAQFGRFLRTLRCLQHIRDSGQPKGFGFVEMPNDAEAQKAMSALTGKDVEGER
jgi:RNA recognition motif-containing protein